MKKYIEKKEGYGHLLLWLIRFSDLVLINLFFASVYYISVHYFGQHFFSYDKKILTFLLINLSYFIVSTAIPLHTSTNIVHVDRIIKSATTTIVFFSVLLTAMFSLFRIISSVSVQVWVFCFILLGGLYVGLHMIIRLSLKSYRRKGYNFKTVVIVGGTASGKAIYNELIGSDFGYRVCGYFDDVETQSSGMPEYLGKIEDVENYVLEENIAEIYCALNNNESKVITNLITFSEKHMVRFFLIPEFFNYIKRKFILRFIDSVPVVSLRNEPLQHLSNRIFKRGFDILFSLFVLIIIFPPVLLIVGFLIKKSSPGPLFFKQQRTGFEGNSFNCYKFRSMRMNESANLKSATKKDPRITRIGAFIRKTSIDELPQFFNVLRGDMSVVGPRPHMLKHTEEYSRIIDKFMVRHLVKPGITGWAQVTGFRGETKTIEDMENRVQKDVWYIEHWSFTLDIKIIIKTVVNAFKGEDNAY